MALQKHLCQCWYTIIMMQTHGTKYHEVGKRMIDVGKLRIHPFQPHLRIQWKSGNHGAHILQFYLPEAPGGLAQYKSPRTCSAFCLKTKPIHWTLRYQRESWTHRLFWMAHRAREAVPVQAVPRFRQFYFASLKNLLELDLHLPLNKEVLFAGNARISLTHKIKEVKQVTGECNPQL